MDIAGRSSAREEAVAAAAWGAVAPPHREHFGPVRGATGGRWVAGCAGSAAVLTGCLAVALAV